MPGTVRYLPRARQELREINNYYLENFGPDIAFKKYAEITAEILYLAETPLLGNTVDRTRPQYKMWLVAQRKYRVYFRRPGQGSIIVYRLHGSNRIPLTVEDL